MTTCNVKVRRTPHNDPDNENDITSLIEISDNVGIEAKTDSFSFSVPATAEFYDFFECEDRIKIYFWNDEGFDSTDSLVIDGFIKDLAYTNTVDRAVWQIKGQNRLERLLNFLWQPSETGTTAPAIIKNLIQQSNLWNKGNKQGLDITAEVTSSGGYIDDESITFETIDYKKGQPTPIFEMIEELSRPEHTGDTMPFMFYLDNENNFHWERKTTASSGTIYEDNCINVKIQKAVYDVINILYLEGGVDFNGHVIRDLVYDMPSAVRYGPKYKYLSRPDIAKTIKSAFGAAPTTDKAHGDEGDYSRGNNAQLRTDVKEGISNQYRGIQQVGQDIVDVLGSPRWKAELTMRGTLGYSLGSNYTLNFDNIFTDKDGNRLDSKLLRLTEITHTFTTKGWLTKLVFEEDEETILGAGAV